MSEDFGKLQEMLEKATAPGAAPLRDADPQVRALREAWLAFGQLLESVPPEAGPSAQCPVVRPAPRAGRRFLLATSLLAASLMIAVAVSWMFRGPAAPSAEQATRDIVLASGPSGAMVQATRDEEKDEEENTSIDALAWNDAFEERITQVEAAMAHLRQEPLLSVNAVEAVQEGIARIEQEFDDNPL